MFLPPCMREYKLALLSFVAARAAHSSRTKIAGKSHIVDALCLSHLVDDADDKVSERPSGNPGHA